MFEVRWNLLRIFAFVKVLDSAKDFYSTLRIRLHPFQVNIKLLGCIATSTFRFPLSQEHCFVPLQSYWIIVAILGSAWDMVTLLNWNPQSFALENAAALPRVASGYTYVFDGNKSTDRNFFFINFMMISIKRTCL